MRSRRWIYMGFDENAFLSIRCSLYIMSLAIVEHCFEHPVRVRWISGLPGSGVAVWRAIAGINALQIAIGCAHTVALIHLGEIDIFFVFGGVLVNDGVSFVVVALTDQPTKNLRGIFGVSDTA